MIVVYILLNDADAKAFAQRPSLQAPAVYQARLKAMQNRPARARTAAGLWLLEQALSIVQAPANTMASLGLAAGGRPCFAHGPAFSISHSHRLVACAIATRGAIGLDVEARRDDVSQRLRQMIAPARDFFDAWCAREATVKASGRVGLARIRGIALNGTIARLDEREWHLSPLGLATGYAACLAHDRPITAGDIRCIDCSSRAHFSDVRGE